MMISIICCPWTLSGPVTYDSSDEVQQDDPMQQQWTAHRKLNFTHEKDILEMEMECSAYVVCKMIFGIFKQSRMDDWSIMGIDRYRVFTMRIAKWTEGEPETADRAAKVTLACSYDQMQGRTNHELLHRPRP
ncbi:hypothetical protein ACLOJK_019995 [Asimina triloba]